MTWEQPVFISSPCPCDEQVFKDFVSKRDQRVLSARSTLESLPDHHLQFILEGEADIQRDDEVSALKAWEAVQRHAKGLAPPVWFAGGFGVEGFQADFDYWAKMERWTFEVCLALSLGVEPEHMNLDRKAKSPIDSKVMDFFSKRVLLIKQKFQPYDEYPTTFWPTPAAFCEWALEKNVDVPKGLLSSVLPNFEQSSPLIENRERNSLLKLVVATAIGGYGFDPSAQRSPIPNQIRDDLIKVGLDMDPDTIRKYLREAAAILPKDFKAE